MSVVVLFGAGASHGAGGVLPTAPPLGAGLYRELASVFPTTWGDFSSSLKGQFRADFEEGMGALWKSRSLRIPLLMQQMAIFFARYNLSSQRIDAYSKLVDDVKHSGNLLRFSSLNYDCLFEIALSMAGRTVNYFADAPVSDSDIIIWKLHGSCNFLPRGGVTATRGIGFSPGLAFETGIQSVCPKEVTTYCMGNTALYPAMAVYAYGKPVQIAPKSIKQIQKSWTTAIESASNVAVIGAKPHPLDKHIWSPLAATKARLLFVGDENAFLAWQSEYRTNGDSTYLGGRFESCIEAIAENL